MNWGKSIVAAFVLFALFIGVLVTVCIRQDISLVSPNYYQEELVYQNQITRLNNAELLAEKPVVRSVKNMIEIKYHNFAHVDRGVLKIFRPSDARFDKNFEFAITQDSVQLFDASQLPAGMYKAKVQWEMDGKEYYIENIINL